LYRNTVFSTRLRPLQPELVYHSRIVGAVRHEGGRPIIDLVQ
jgi:hypothetical protein